MLHVAEQLAICYRRLGSMAKLPAQVTSGGAVKPKSNRTSADEPCAKYADLRRPVLGEIGVKIDATGPWSVGFRGVLSFWNTVLVANFHEETNLGACAIRVIDGGPDIVNNGHRAFAAHRAGQFSREDRCESGIEGNELR